MARFSSGKLRVGLVGLGRLWETRHKPALARMRDRFQVVGIYDQVARRAEIEASRLKCRSFDGLGRLVEDPSIDVVYCLAPQWFGLHPVELAAKAGKPVYTALPMPEDEKDRSRLDALVRRYKVAIVPEFTRRFHPSTQRLRELLATRLGPARKIFALTRIFGPNRHEPAGSAAHEPVSLLQDPGSFLIDFCRVVFQADPTAVQGWERESANDSTGVLERETFDFDYPDGRSARITIERHPQSLRGKLPKGLPPSGIQIIAERGTAWLEPPDMIQWSDPTGQHTERLPLEPSVGSMLNDHFHRLIRGVATLAPTWNDRMAIDRSLAAIRRSIREKSRIVI